MKAHGGTVALHKHTVIVGKAGIGTVDCKEVWNIGMTNDPGDSELHFQESTILQDISNIMVPYC